MAINPLMYAFGATFTRYDHRLQLTDRLPRLCINRMFNIDKPGLFPHDWRRNALIHNGPAGTNSSWRRSFKITGKGMKLFSRPNRPSRDSGKVCLNCKAAKREVQGTTETRYVDPSY